MNDGVNYENYRGAIYPTPLAVKAGLSSARGQVKNFGRRFFNNLQYELAGDLAGQMGAFSRTHENYSRRQYELLKSGLGHYLSHPIKYPITNMRLSKPATRSRLNQLAGGRTRRNRGRKIERTRRRRHVY